MAQTCAQLAQAMVAWAPDSQMGGAAGALQEAQTAVLFLTAALRHPAATRFCV